MTCNGVVMEWKDMGSKCNEIPMACQRNCNETVMHVQQPCEETMECNDHAMECEKQALHGLASSENERYMASIL